MVKRRPVVVLTPRLPHRNGLCCVVPLSGSQPVKSVPYVVRLELDEPLPHPFPEKIFWAKCDMIATVSHERLDLFRTARISGQRKYLQPKVNQDCFDALMCGVLQGLGLAHLTLHRPSTHW